MNIITYYTLDDNELQIAQSLGTLMYLLSDTKEEQGHASTAEDALKVTKKIMSSGAQLHRKDVFSFVQYLFDLENVIADEIDKQSKIELKAFNEAHLELIQDIKAMRKSHLKTVRTVREHFNTEVLRHDLLQRTMDE